MALIAAAAARKAGGGKVNPRQIAQAIVDHLPAGALVGKTEIAGPGFINFFAARLRLPAQAH